MRALILCVVLAGCIKIEPADGTLRCAASGKLCPEGYSCVAGFCSRGGGAPDMSIEGDLAGADLTGADLTGVAPTCTDGQMNQGESDIDCGGPCGKCTPYKHCGGNVDCTTGACAETYCVPASGPPNWIAGPDLLTARNDGAAGSAGDKLWAIGGAGPGVATESLTGSAWTAGTQVIAIGTSSLAAVGDGTNVWIMGGRESDGTRVNRAFAGAGTWTAIAGLTVDRSSLAAAVGPDGKIYAIGGSPEPGATASAYGPTVESYTPPPVAPANRLWDGAPPDLPFGRFRHAAATTDGQIFVVGGSAFTGVLKNTISWKPGDAQWTTKADLIDARSDHGLVAAPDGRLFAIGGQEGVTRRASVELYVPSLNRWFAGPPLPGGARSGLAAAIGPDGRIFALGGSDGTMSLKRVEYYGPALAIIPDNGPPNTNIQIAGTNFASNATVSIHLNTLTSAAIGTSQTNAAGAMTTPVQYTVPNATPGGTKILLHAVDNRSLYPVKLVFTVN